jgi:hypothetical protein
MRCARTGSRPGPRARATQHELADATRRP